MNFTLLRSLPDRERAVFLFGNLFDKENCANVFTQDFRHEEIFSSLIEGIENFSINLRPLVLLSLLD